MMLSEILIMFTGGLNCLPVFVPLHNKMMPFGLGHSVDV